MMIRTVTSVARRVTEPARDQARAMARALGLSVVLDEPGKLLVTTADGDLLEYLPGDQARPEDAGVKDFLGALSQERRS